MKRMIRILVLAAALCSLLVLHAFAAEPEGLWTDHAYQADFAGSGTKEDPYQIGTPAQLAKLAADVNGGTAYEDQFFRLTADLDLSGHYWVPIGTKDHPFRGYFYGDAFQIQAMQIKTSKLGTPTRVGLFGSWVVSNTETSEHLVLQDLWVRDAAVTIDTEGVHYAGILAGWLNSQGGLYYTDIQLCGATGTITATQDVDYLGGLIGGQGDTEGYALNRITAGFFRGTIAAQGGLIHGGLLGDGNGINFNCYVSAALTSKAPDVYPVAGMTCPAGIYRDQSNYGCFYNKDLCTAAIADAEEQVEGRTETEMKADAFLVELNYDPHLSQNGNNWTREPGVNEDYPVPRTFIHADLWTDYAATEAFAGTGTQADPFLIGTPEQLAKLAADVNSGTAYENKFFRLTADLDLSTHYWVPIGTRAHPFMGNVDGADHVLSGLKIRAALLPDTLDLGLFGRIRQSAGTNKEAELCHIFLEGPEILVENQHQQARTVGTLAGRIYGTQVTGCGASNISIEAKATVDYLGGLVGYSAYYVTGSYCRGKIQAGSGMCHAGLLGYFDNHRIETNITGNCVDVSITSSAGKKSPIAGRNAGRYIGYAGEKNVYNKDQWPTYDDWGANYGLTTEELKTSKPVGLLNKATGSPAWTVDEAGNLKPCGKKQVGELQLPTGMRMLAGSSTGPAIPNPQENPEGTWVWDPESDFDAIREYGKQSFKALFMPKDPQYQPVWKMLTVLVVDSTTVEIRLPQADQPEEPANVIKVTVKFPMKGHVVCGIFDAEGRMLWSEIKTVWESTSTSGLQYTFTYDESLQPPFEVRVFLLDEQYGAQIPMASTEKAS